MRHGLTERTLATLNRVLARHPEVERAILYGSRALGSQRPGSDIDLALEGTRVDQQVCASVWQQLDASDIPQQVDITLLAALTHVALREHIGRVGVVIYRRGT